MVGALYATPYGSFPDPILSGSKRLPTRFVVASGGVLSEGYGHGGPGVCQGDGQTEAEEVPSQGGRGDVTSSAAPASGVRPNN